ncbi:anti-anti-sigma regulatory factor (antagonist of anti-sigma factor) [Saprospira grandis DSM 2844]|uniref:Anti-anti-sigma regulatory factor (Antagonist of anti-sigma factor) n=1 Tax=Saprospira grandis DSM 2844 TaxID=694433 RepID=J1I376_9BACT|nr:STAS domain-containing protein [Saprospira grandis]EJF53135.1 anti-anti-sigma regulatory factor (antagonist of anti-sigma factor) [Saprospira grandis DSM 2844]
MELKKWEKSVDFYKQQYFISDEDLNCIRQAGEQIMDQMRWAYDQLYDWMRQHKRYEKYYTEELISLLAEEEELFWTDIVLGRLSNDYIHTEAVYGLEFAKMNIPLEGYVGALVAFHEFIRQSYVRKGVQSFELMSAFKKFTQVSIDVVTEVYQDIISHQLEEQNKALRERSTPVAQIAENVLLLPLVGFIDSKRAKDMMESMLSNIAKEQAKVFILDISGVAIVDTAVANHLIKMTKASRLMGCHCIISGISGPIAQTIVELGIQIDEIDTRGSMRDALAAALNRNL